MSDVPTRMTRSDREERTNPYRDLTTADASVAVSLAESVVDTSAKFADFEKAAKTVYGKRASKPGSMAALREAWSLASPAWRTHRNGQ